MQYSSTIILCDRQVLSVGKSGYSLFCFHVIQPRYKRSKLCCCCLYCDSSKLKKCKQLNTFGLSQSTCRWIGVYCSTSDLYPDVQSNDWWFTEELALGTQGDQEGERAVLNPSSVPGTRPRGEHCLYLFNCNIQSADRGPQSCCIGKKSWSLIIHKELVRTERSVSTGEQLQ